MNDILAAGAKDLAAALKDHTALQVLDLRVHRISAAGAKALAQALQDNTAV